MKDNGSSYGKITPQVMERQQGRSWKGKRAIDRKIA